MGISQTSLQVCACEWVAEAEYIIVIGAPMGHQGHHTPRVEILQPTNYPSTPRSSPMVPYYYHETYFTTKQSFHK